MNHYCSLGLNSNMNMSDGSHWPVLLLVMAIRVQLFGAYSRGNYFPFELTSHWDSELGFPHYYYYVYLHSYQGLDTM
jgi:hypothetical protein